MWDHLPLCELVRTMLWTCSICHWTAPEEPNDHTEEKCHERVVWHFNTNVEREFANWLNTPKGQFAQYYARRDLR
jgi:hypothetical protein